MATPQKTLSLDELAQQYGYAASFFNSDSELRGLIQKATKEQWSIAKFQAAFMASGWYRNHAASVRQWLEENTRDPQTAARQTQQAALKIQQLASQEGVTLDNGRIQQMAKDSLMWGWNDQELKSAVGSEFSYSGKGTTQGSAASLEDQVRAAANDYGMTVSDLTVGGWLKNLTTGSITMDNVNSQLRDWAMSKYPGLSTYLSQGQTVRQIADPYIQSYSALMEKPAGTVQLTDPLIQKALQGTPQPPAKSGSVTATAGPKGTSTPVAPQSLYDFESTLRQDPRWLQTKNAHDTVMNATMGVLKDWGLYK